MKRHGIGIDGQEFKAIGPAGGERPDRLDGRTGSPATGNRPAVKSAQDLDDVRSLEERYGIREEGIF